MFRAIPVVPSEVSLPRHPNWSWDYDKGQTFDRLIEAQHWATGVIIGWPNVVTYVEIRDDHGVVQVFDNPDFGDMSNDTVSITVSRTDWEAVLAALKTAAECMRERSLRASDPEVHYNLDKAASHYHDLAARISALEVN